MIPLANNDDNDVAFTAVMVGRNMMSYAGHKYPQPCVMTAVLFESLAIAT